MAENKVILVVEDNDDSRQAICTMLESLGYDHRAFANGDDRSITWKNKLGEYAYKPLLGCVVCMGSVWGVLGSVYFGRIDQIPVMYACVS